MSGCTSESWTLRDIAEALINERKDNKRIVVPMFQRGKRWKKDQEKTFIDSIIKGYPVGTMLFYEKYEDGVKTYILVDGLQRGNSIKKYITNPTNFLGERDIPDDLCQDILNLYGENNDKYYSEIRKIIMSFIQ